MQNKNKGMLGWLIAIILVFTLWSAFSEFAGNITKTDYSSLLRCIKNGSISELYINSTTARAKVGDKVITCEIPSVEVLQQDAGDELVKMIESGKLSYQIAEKRVSWTDYLIPISSILMLVLFALFIFGQGGGKGGVANFTKSRAKLNTDSQKSVKFEDVAGADEEKNPQNPRQKQNSLKRC